MNAPDPASLERTVFVPFESTFCDPTLAPATEEQQFKERVFPARRDLTGARCAALAHRLIYMFFVASANHGLNAPMATLPLTARMRLEARQHFKEVEHFRYYIQHCVRPVGCNGSSLTMRPYLTQATQRTLHHACERITSSHAAWLRLHNRTFGTLWEDLPAEDRVAWHEVGSPACHHSVRIPGGWVGGGGAQSRGVSSPPGHPYTE
jgi:hypothetical protein